ncbi:MAG: DegV family protein [Chloroflexota bacterium]
MTDSTSCLPPDVVKEYDIRVVPATLMIDGKAYSDQVSLTSDEFWRMFKEAKDIPTTGAISSGAFAATFLELSKSVDGIVCILVSGALSAIHESAVQAREMVKSRDSNTPIEIIDSKTSSHPTRL